VVSLYIEGPSIQHWFFEAMTRTADTVRGPSVQAPFYAITKVYGANFDFVATPSVPIRGTVRDKATGKPLAGVEITDRKPFGAGTTYIAHPDNEGRYELLGYPRSETYYVWAQPTEGQLYFAEKVARPDTPGSDSITADFDLISGIPLSGRVTDAATKKPVKGAKVYYYPRKPNRYAARIVYGVGVGASSATTRPDGSFSLAVLPGPGVIACKCLGNHPYMWVTAAELRDFFKDREFQAFREDVLQIAPSKDSPGDDISQEEYHALALINPNDKAESVKQDLTVRPGKTLTGNVLGTDGKPLVGATMDDWSIGHRSFVSLATASFTLTNVNPRRTRQLEFNHKEKGLGLFKLIRCEGTESLSLKLQPYGSVIGRILDKDGKPVPDVPMRLRTHVSETDFRPKTDRQGRFRVDELVVGYTYSLVPLAGQAILTLEDGKEISFPEFTVEPGKVKDLGDAKPKPRKGGN
jgi:protocatechuate 3,4-dioxygenase beta subunit